MSEADGRDVKRIEMGDVDSREQESLLLPQGLGGDILQLQMECDSESVSSQLIVKLIELYSKAIEYYESMNSQKSKIFQHRIQTVLSRPIVQSVLKGKSSILSQKKEQLKRKQAEAQFISGQQIKMLIDRFEEKAQDRMKTIGIEIKSQEQLLTTRIKRRRSMSNKSTLSQNQDLQNLQPVPEAFLYPLKDKLLRKVYI